MLSKRREPFRFSFRRPIHATIHLIKVSDRIDENPRKSSSGNVEILDISPSGLKIQTAFDIPISERILMEFNFIIYEHPISVTGSVMWRNKVSSKFHYGIRLKVTPELKRKIIDELKKHSKKLHQDKI